MLDEIVSKLYLSAREKNIIDVECAIVEASQLMQNPKILGLGCYNGKQMKFLTRKVVGAELHGIEIEEDSVVLANQIGIKAVVSDLEKPFPFSDCAFDIVYSNQVIEHLDNVDNFVEEMFRVCKPGGYAIISTENLSSIDNLFALALGYQAFSQNISKRISIGNPLSPGYKREMKSYWGHRTIFTLKGLCEMLEYYGFKVFNIKAKGLTPLETIEKTHARLITITVVKPDLR